MQTKASRDIRVLIVDGHALFRAGVRALLGDHDGVLVVAECGSAQEACELAASEQPDVILLELDLGLGQQQGLDALPRLLEAAPDTSVLIVTGERDKAMHQAAMLQGASGIVTKDKPSKVLLKAIECVHAGEAWFDRSEIGSLLRDARAATNAHPGPAAQLTDRELQIVALICEGLDNRRIATRLHLSTKTVRNHLSSVFQKLGVADRLGLAIFALRQGLGSTRTAPGEDN
jgi:two-component system, NarL family, nitrate/nitrite response regulator NarL